MSDQVGFHYQRSPGPIAAGDFLGKLHAIGDACRHNPATLVSVILDGENCWEYYPDGGVSFLRSLYQGAVRDPTDQAGEGRRVRPRASAGRHPAPAVRRELDQPQFRDLDRPSRRQPRLGRPARDPAVPGRPRSAPAGTTRRPSPGPGKRSTSPRARTGSGGTATITRSARTACSTTSSASTCATSTRSWAATRPGSLFTPISQAGSHRPINDQPTSFLNVKVDGRATYFEWIDGGTLLLRQRPRDHDAGRPRGCSTASGSVSTPSGSCSGSTPREARPPNGSPRSIACGSASSTRPSARSWWSSRRSGIPSPTSTMPAARWPTARPSPWPPARSSSWPSRSPARPESGRPDPLLRRASQGRVQPRPRPPRGHLRAQGPLPGLRADHVAGVREVASGQWPVGSGSRWTDGIGSRADRLTRLMPSPCDCTATADCHCPLSATDARRPDHARAAKRPDRRPVGDHRA